jgi:cytoskeletal protein RodZ
MEPSFGPILKKQRESQGLSLRQISVAIKMSPNVIQDIEEENFNNLPQAVFLRGLVKTYCRHLNLDEKEILDIFDQTTKYEKTGAKRSPIDDESALKTPTYVWLSRVFIPIFIIAVLGITGTVIVLITKKYDKEIKSVIKPNVTEIHRAKEEQGSADISTTPATDVTVVDAATVKPPETNDAALVEKKVTQVITLEPLAKTLVFVKVDDSENQKIILRPDVNKTFQALNKIKLIIQDGGAVNIIHNNKDIGVPGVFGQEIELNFPVK